MLCKVKDFGLPAITCSFVNFKNRINRVIHIVL